MTSYGIGMALTFTLLASAGVSARAQDSTSSRDRQNSNPLAAAKLSDIRSFAERPLFAPTRRPAEAEQEARTEAEQPVKSPPEFVLLGVTSGPQGSVARITSSEGKPAQSLRMGEIIDGWALRSVDRSSVIMTQAGKTIVLTIFRGKESDGDAKTESSATGLIFGSEEPFNHTPAVRVITPN